MTVHLMYLKSKVHGAEKQRPTEAQDCILVRSVLGRGVQKVSQTPCKSSRLLSNHLRLTDDGIIPGLRHSFLAFQIPVSSSQTGRR